MANNIDDKVSALAKSEGIKNINTYIELKQKIDELENSNSINTDEYKKLNKILAQVKKELNDIASAQTKLEKSVKKWDETHGMALTKLKMGWNDVNRGIAGVLSSSKSLLEPWAKADKAASSYAKSVGMTGVAIESLRKNTVKFISDSDIAIRFNKSAEELLKLQQTYSTTVGRNILLSNKQKESFAALSAVVGDDMAVRLSTQMENFGLSADEAGKRVTAIFNDSSEKGIAFETYAKNFADNIKIAQNYTFKEGLRGLAAMVEKSVAIKLNLSQATALADKVSTVEGAIKTASQLQVLGGPFAAYSNPLAMMYEGLNDIGKLQDRIINMYGNLGSFNYKTGEMEVSAFNKMRIKKAAETMGLDYSNVMESINAQGKRNAMDDVLDNIGLTKSQKEFLYNKATFQDGQWGVSDLKGNFHKLSDITKGGSNNSQLQTLINENKSEAENIADIAEMLRSYFDKTEGFQKGIQNEQAKILEPVGKMVSDAVERLGSIDGLVKTIAYISLAKNIFPIAGGIYNTINGLGRIGQGVGGTFSGGIGNGKTPAAAPRGYTYRGGSWYRNNKTGKNVFRRADGTFWTSNHKNATQVNSPKNNGGWSTAARIKTGLGLGAASYGLDIWQNNRVANNNFQGTTTLGISSSALKGASLGAMFGWPGVLVGGLIGLGVGALSNNTKKEIEQQLGVKLNGKYSEKEYQTIATTNSYSLLNSSLKEKIKNNGDDEQLKQYFSNKKGYANGGILSGPSHINGGMPILGSNQVVEGGEFVVNKESTKRHFNELQKINSETSSITPIEPLGKTLKVIENVAKSCEITQNKTKNDKIQIEPININFNGTIKLDTGKQNIDITREIRENPQLLREITNMITKQININMNGAFNKNDFRQKYI